MSSRRSRRSRRSKRSRRSRRGRISRISRKMGEVGEGRISRRGGSISTITYQCTDTFLANKSILHCSWQVSTVESQ